MKKILTLFVVACAVEALAVVKPAGIFTDNTVLQQGEPVRIWGTADPGEKIVVKFAGQKEKTRAGTDGKWRITLKPLTASAEPRVLTIGEEKLANVVVGEVWLAGGQSNMATTMQTYRKTSQPEIHAANDPLLRMVTIPALHYAGQNSNVPQWKNSIPENVKNFSATAYYFAKNLRAELGVPVGIVSCSVGATPAEAWMSRKTLSGKPALKRTIDAYDHHVKTAFTDLADYIEQDQAANKAMAEWHKLRAEGQKTKKPKEVMGPHNFKRPCGLYDNMLTQTIPYTIKGVIWYQGENNASQQAGLHYRTVFSSLIEEWRTDFENPKLPFLFVQLATLGWGRDSHWPEVRDAQRWVAENVANTGMVVLLDGGEKEDIHPHSKDIAGLRLSLLARNLAYGEKKLVCNGPILTDTNVRGSTVELSFARTGSGLVLKDGGENTFEVCGEDGAFVPATAELKEGKIIISAEGISEPKYIRYGWHKWVVPTLYNAEGLPASPFRTDHYPFASEGRYFLDWVKIE